MAQWFMLAFLIAAQAPQKSAQSSAADDFLMGGPDAPVKIELFSDFQCPSCRSFYLDTINRLIPEYSGGGKVAVIFREFPLSIHPVAREASRYAVASKGLGREQWLKVIEQIYTCQAEWSYNGKIEPVIARILPEKEMEKLKEALKNPAIEQAVNHDVSLGENKKVTSTPTFFLTVAGKEQRVDKALPFAVLKAYIDPYLK